MKIGDLVILRSGRYNFSATEKAKWTWTNVLGVITDDRGFVDGTAEYRVLTTDGKHAWSHIEDLSVPEKP